MNSVFQKGGSPTDWKGNIFILAEGVGAMKMNNPRSLKMILVLIGLEDRHLDAIRTAAPGAQIIVLSDPKEMAEKLGSFLPDVEVILANPYRDRTMLTEILNAPRLRWIQQRSAGANWLMDYPRVAESDLIVTNASGIHAIPISEHILALMFCLARDVQRSIRDQVEHRWNRIHRVAELDGQTMGLIGLGAVGEKTAEKAKVLNMRVLGVRRHPGCSTIGVDQTYGPENLLEVLPQADWVVITAPLTPETKGMIGERELKALKKSAYMINVSRGSIIQEQALVKALQEKWIAGAGLDVFEQEPLPASSPLWDMENVVITAHYAGGTPHYLDRLMEIFLENLRRYQARTPLINTVDKRLGY
jgi:phosphoglycerate dehydrogenase-like enzyme